MACQRVLRKQHQLAVWKNDLAIFRDQAEAVAIAIERQADFGIGFLQAADQILQIFRVRRIGVMVREMPIDFAEQLNHFAAERAVQIAGEGTGDAIAAIDRDFHWPRQFYVAGYPLQVRFTDVVRPITAAALRDSAVFDGLVQRLDRLAMNCFTFEHHLEAVVIRRVVAAGDHDAGLRFQHMGAEIHHWCRHHPQIDHVDASGLQPGCERGRQFRPGQAAIAADDDGFPAFRKNSRAECLADTLRDRRVQRTADDAANVVGLEDSSGKSEHDVIQER